MVDKYSPSVDQIIKIKNKLNKYFDLNNDEKVNEYLDVLAKLNMNTDLLQKSDLGKLMQTLKRSSRSYSTKAAEIVNKWKSLVMSSGKQEFTNNINSDKKPVVVKPKVNEAAAAPPPPVQQKQQQVIKSSKSKPIIPAASKQIPNGDSKKPSSQPKPASTTVIQSSKPTNEVNNKKRASSSQLVDAKQQVPEKKQKISYTDYFSKKGSSIKSKSEESNNSNESDDDNFDDIFGDNDDDSFNRNSDEIKKRLNEQTNPEYKLKLELDKQKQSFWSSNSQNNNNNHKNGNNIFEEENEDDDDGEIDYTNIMLPKKQEIHKNNSSFGSNSSDDKLKPKTAQNVKNEPTKPVKKDEKPKNNNNNNNNKIIEPPKPNTPLPITLGNLIPSSTTSSISNGFSSSHLLTSSTSQTKLNNNYCNVEDVSKKRPSKRLLYTGKKDGSSKFIPKLYDLSVKVLTETIDELPQRIYLHNLNTISGFPLAFDLVKPVLERANAKQLQNIENYSPDFLEHTDYLWNRLCNQEFKDAVPDDEETWRELYFRKFDEREERFQRARDLISSKQAAKPKVRQTQLASEVKSGRRPTIITSNNIRTSRPSIKASMPLDLAPVAIKRASTLSTSSAATQAIKAAKGSLMQKTLKMMKTMRR